MNMGDIMLSGDTQFKAELQTDIIKILEHDYEKLINKPSINGVELIGNKQLSELGIEIPTNPGGASEETLASIQSQVTQLSTSINTKANKKKVYNITLDTTWTGTEAPYTKTIAIEGILATDEPNIKPVWSETLETRQTEKEEYNKISLVTTSAGSLIFTCDEDKPSVSLNLKAEVVY